MRRVIFGIACLTIIGCGDGDKGLFSVWKESKSGLEMDLTNGKMGGTFKFFYQAANGGSDCTAIVSVDGSEKSGKAAVAYADGGDECELVEGGYTYSKEKTVLILCKKVIAPPPDVPTSKATSSPCSYYE